jgi:hypothetical protein
VLSTLRESGKIAVGVDATRGTEVLSVECMQTTVSSGATYYPVYIGFLAAKEIARVAEAPSFQITTPHQQIAANIASQPVKDWQRPLSESRVEIIANTFDDTGHLMPNPVLLAQNAFVSGKIEIVPKTIAGSPTLTGTYVVNIDDTNLGHGQKPLWILDGQHRIMGLSKSKQQENPIPIVLLLDGGTGSYTSPLLASLFAQVTTSATKLDDLHNEWLTFAFELDNYSLTSPNADAVRKSFETVASLCRTTTYQKQANPFYNAVQFNEHISVNPVHGGFRYKCTELKNLLYRHYYNQPSAGGHISPYDLAEQIALAYSDLYSVVGSQADSVFFGAPAKQQAIMQDAFLVGVCTRILTDGAPASWSNLLKALKFHQTNWDFSWIRSLSGPANTTSKRIAENVMSDALSRSELPSGSNTIADHLKGNAASITIAFSALTPAGRPTTKGRILYEALRGSTGSQAAQQHPHIKVIKMSTNIGKLEVVDATKKGKPFYYRDINGRGMLLGSGIPNPLELMFIMTHYGDLHHEAELQVNW